MTGSVTADQPIARRPDSLTELPLSPQQQSWWAMCTRYPEALTPVLTVTYRLRGPLVVDAWLRAFGAVVDRHESLRTRFVTGGREPVQVVDPPNGFDVERIDLRDLPAPAREERAGALLRDRARTAVDLAHGPLVTACLVRLADDDHVWMLRVHHILADGASMSIIDRELCTLYGAFVDGGDPELTALPVRYGDYLVWQRDTHPERHEDDLRYWTEHLVGVPMLALRTTVPRSASTGAPAAQWEHVVGAELLARVLELGRARRCTLYMVLLAAVQVLLVRHSGQREFCFGAPVIGRHTMIELEPLVGLFANLVTVRCDVSDDPTFRELLARTRRTVLDALHHQDLPFSRVVPLLGAPPDDGGPQAFQVLFDLDQTPGQGLPGYTIEAFPVEAVPKSVHDLVIIGSAGEAGLTFQFIHNTVLFPTATIAELARDMEELLRAGVERPDTRVSTLAGTG